MAPTVNAVSLSWRNDMSGKTVYKFEVKFCNDNVYDLFVNGEWLLSRGSYRSILDEIEKIMLTYEGGNV